MILRATWWRCASLAAVLGLGLIPGAGCTRPNDAGLVDSVGEQRARADDATRALHFAGAMVVKGSIEDRLDARGPRLESVYGPDGARPNEPISYRLVVPLAAAQVTPFALLQWKYAESYLRIPIAIDPATGQGSIAGVSQPSGDDLSDDVDGIICLEDEHGRAGPGIPITYEPAEADDPQEVYGTVLSAHTGSTLAVDLFDRDGEHLLATGGDDTAVCLWNADSGHLLRTLQGHSGAVTCLSATGDGARLASGSRDHTVRIWDSHTGNLLMTLGEHRDVVTWIAHSPDDRLLASGSWDGTVRIHDVVQPGAVKTLDIGQRVSMVEFSRDGASLAVASGTLFQPGRLAVWNVADWSPRFSVDLDREVTALNFSAASDRVAAAVGRGQIYVWDVVTGGLLASLQGGPADTVPRLGFWPGSSGYLAALTLAGTMFIWDIQSGQLGSKKRTRLWLTSADFSGDGSLMALGDSRGMVRLTPTMAALPR